MFKHISFDKIEFHLDVENLILIYFVIDIFEFIDNEFCFRN
jgi:hypothetical protein